MDTTTDPATENTDAETIDDASLDPATTDAMPGDPPPPDEPAPPTDGPNGSPPPQARRGAWHVMAIIVGALMLLPATGLLTGGVSLTVASQVATDDGYFAATLEPIESEGVAIAAFDFWDEAAEDDDVPWVLDWLDVDIRLRTSGIGPSDEVFVGIARTVDIERYLDGAEFSRIREFDDAFPVYVEESGATDIDAPTLQNIWVESADGVGEQEITWDVRRGDWAAVVMNADGSPAVAADVEIGVRSGVITPIGITLIVIGGVMLLASVTLLVVGVRGRRR